MANIAIAAAPSNLVTPASSHQTLGGLRKRYLEDARHAIGRDEAPKSKRTAIETTPGPDIQWNPSFETYQARVEALSKLDIERPTTLPGGFPESIESSRVWTGADFGDEAKFVMRLDEAQVLEIDRALSYFKTRRPRLGLDEVSRQMFPLPTLKLKLKNISRNLHFGIGFSVIRGLDPRRYSAFDNVIIYLGITSYVAEQRGCQDSEGNMLIHIKDLGDERPNSELRQAPYARNAQPFHTDVCDILAMYVQNQAPEGGESHLASCGKIYNDIARTRPDVIHTLAEPNWIFDKHQKPAYWNRRQLLFNFKDHGPGFCFSRRPITGSPASPRSPGVPPMTEVQAEALDMVHFTAVEHKLTMQLQRGDIQLINNLAVFHARSGFRDTPMQKRHIMRLWLRNEELAWQTPEGLQRTWFEKYGDSERRKIAKWNAYAGATRERILSRSHSCS
ncbi:Clavaminate synthase-like protein [Rhizodiscina lignyota]|uniref:Clavaminate synthase-like protein n=1 Tax=Rhizodiscina lignyota TaxID=1504668 RepID=A0A9P4IPH3_9PEZI|nr:Clavaminate synthase-like protein [Rhizodiscina lignyota]